MLAHFLGNGTKPDTREVVDGKARVFRIIQWEHASAQCLDLRIREAFFKCR